MGIVDVANAAGVTVGTVSRVLNGDPTVRVRPETRERILAAAKAVRYTPNHAARALRKSRVGAIALAVHDISNPVYASIIAGAQAAASSEGYVLMLTDITELARDTDVFSRVVRSGAVDGMLLLPAGSDVDTTVARATAGLVPTVIVNDSSSTLASVSLDDKAAAELAAQYLLDLGHQRIGVLSLDGDTSRARARAAGFRQAMRRHGLAQRREWNRLGGHTVDTGRSGMEQILASNELPTAVLTGSVLAAVGAIGAITAHGLSVPHDMSVIGFHDVFFARDFQPAITVVELPLRQLGEESVRLLLKIIAGGPNEHLTINDPSPRITVRNTTTSPPSRG